MASIEENLRAMRDVQGVLGSFVVAASGVLVSCELPGVPAGDALGELGPRLVRLVETFASGDKELESALVRYEEHKLYLRRMTWGMLGVVAQVGVNLPALRMVANLVVRRIDPEVLGAASARASSPPPTPPSKPTPTPTPPAAVPDRQSAPPPSRGGEDSHVRMYRGRRVLS